MRYIAIGLIVMSLAGCASFNQAYYTDPANKDAIDAKWNNGLSIISDVIGIAAAGYQVPVK
jgi:hypothetical protein